MTVKFDRHVRASLGEFVLVDQCLERDEIATVVDQAHDHVNRAWGAPEGIPFELPPRPRPRGSRQSPTLKDAARFTHMETTNVDPRDQRWEIGEPSYRVYFHTADGSSEEHEVTAGDVDEVIEWAEDTAAGRTFILYACVEHDGLGLVRLLGTDPNET